MHVVSFANSFFMSPIRNPYSREASFPSTPSLGVAPHFQCRSIGALVSQYQGIALSPGFSTEKAHAMDGKMNEIRLAYKEEAGHILAEHDIPQTHIDTLFRDYPKLTDKAKLALYDKTFSRLTAALEGIQRLNTVFEKLYVLQNNADSDDYRIFSQQLTKELKATKQLLKTLVGGGSYPPEFIGTKEQILEGIKTFLSHDSIFTVITQVRAGGEMDKPFLNEAKNFPVTAAFGIATGIQVLLNMTFPNEYKVYLPKGTTPPEIYHLSKLKEHWESRYPTKPFDFSSARRDNWVIGDAMEIPRPWVDRYSETADQHTYNPDFLPERSFWTCGRLGKPNHEENDIIYRKMTPSPESEASIRASESLCQLVRSCVTSF